MHAVVLPHMKPQHYFQQQCEVQLQSQTGHNHIPHTVAGLHGTDDMRRTFLPCGIVEPGVVAAPQS